MSLFVIELKASKGLYKLDFVRQMCISSSTKTHKSCSNPIIQKTKSSGKLKSIEIPGKTAKGFDNYRRVIKFYFL